MSSLLYFAVPLVLLFYFELLGQTIVFLCGMKRMRYNFPIGFLSFLGLTYVVYYPMVRYQTSFNCVVLATFLLFAICSVAIYSKRNQIVIHFDKWSLVFALTILLQFLVMLYHTVGDIGISDGLTYTDLISVNVGIDKIGSLHYDTGFPSFINPMYNYQSFYLLGSVLVGVVHKISSLIGFKYYYFTSSIWLYAIILYFLKVACLSNVIEYFGIKNKMLIVFFAIFWLCLYGMLYISVEEAYFGNAYRIYAFAYLLLFSYEMLKKTNKYLDLAIVLICMSLGATASCNAMPTCIYMFVLMLFCASKNKNIVSLSVVSVFLLIINFMEVLYLPKALRIIAVITMISAIVINKYIYALISRKNMFLIAMLASFVALVVCKYVVLGDVFDMSGACYTLFYFKDGAFDFEYFNSIWSFSSTVIVWICVAGILVAAFEGNDVIMTVIACSLVIFLNPVLHSFWQNINIVWARSFDLIVNPFSFMVGYSSFFRNTRTGKIASVSLCLLCVVGSISLYKRFQTFYRYLPNEKFDQVLRMDSDQADVIDFLLDRCYYDDIADPVIICPSIQQIKTEIAHCRPLFGRWRSQQIKSESFDELYKIFYPSDYYGDPNAPEDPDYEHLARYINESGVDIIVQSKEILYHSEMADSYYSLHYYINECGFVPAYENEGYAVYVIQK